MKTARGVLFFGRALVFLRVERKQTTIHKSMYRTKTCGELRIGNVGEQVTLAGWVQRSRKMGGMTFIDLRDRYGLTQLVFNQETDAPLCERANKLGREYVIQVTGCVSERFSKNDKMPTGDIEIIVSELNVLNEALTPPFTIEEQTDGGDDLRMKYRYLDLRRECVRRNLELRHKFCIETRSYLDSQGFLEIETPQIDSGIFGPQSFEQVLKDSAFERNMPFSVFGEFISCCGEIRSFLSDQSGLCISGIELRNSQVLPSGHGLMPLDILLGGIVSVFEFCQSVEFYPGFDQFLIMQQIHCLIFSCLHESVLMILEQIWYILFFLLKKMMVKK